MAMVDRSGQQLDNYQLISMLGRGTFGDVYLAEHIYRKTRVAVKVLQMRLSNDEFFDFINEARVFRLRHPNIVPVLDFGVERTTGTPFIVMSYASKGTLRLRHPRSSRLPLGRVVAYVNQISAALHYAHEENLVHRDIKPENMLIAEDDSILLSDFGIATMSQSMHYTSNPGQAAGTPSYMAPEQFLGKPGRASDQYALGIAVYEWLCGGYPFNGTFYELFGQHMQVEPPPLPRSMPLYSQNLEKVIFRALAKNPDERFPGVIDFARALEEQYKQSLTASQALTILVKSKEEFIREGDVLCDEQRYMDAIMAYSLAIALAPDEPLAYNNRALAYRNLQDYQKALADYNRALELDPNSPITYNNRGYAYFLLRDYQRALSDYNSALALEQNFALAYTNRGTVFCIFSEFPRAIADFDRAITLDQNNMLAYYNRGNALDEIGEFEKAIADFTRAIALNPNYVSAYANRAYVYRNLGEYQKAIDDYDRALELDPRNANASNGRQIALSKIIAELS